MPLFVCDTCNGIENTALGTARDKETGKYRGFLVKDHGSIEALCSECMPNGVWHGKFPKANATEALVRERGLWPVPHTGFIHLGKFEHLRPELEKQQRNAIRREKRKLKGDS